MAKRWKKTRHLSIYLRKRGPCSGLLPPSVLVDPCRFWFLFLSFDPSIFVALLCNSSPFYLFCVAFFCLFLKLLVREVAFFISPHLEFLLLLFEQEKGVTGAGAEGEGFFFLCFLRVLGILRRT